MNRREFIGNVTALATTGALGGCALPRAAVPRAAMPKEMWGFLAHFGVKMWERRADYPRFDFDYSVWRTATDRMAEKGVNTLVIDLGEGLVYPSHPELGLPGSWEPERMRDEISRLKRTGILAVPKLNFSATHDQWLGKWRRYLSTPEYYGVCAEIIRDVAEIFDESPLFHLGWDEETYALQDRPCTRMVRLRRGDLWWNDCLFTIGEAEKHGMRPWIWSDAYWHHPEEFLKRMPKNVLQSNWYYGRDLSEAHLRHLDETIGPTPSGPRVPIVRAYRELSEAGYDQVPTGSTYRKNDFQTQNFPALVRYCRKTVAPGRLKGFLMAPWIVENKRESLDKLLRSADNVAEARGG